jgi:hypothetical protein
MGADMNWDAFDAKYQHAWPYRLAMWAAEWLCQVLSGIVLGSVVFVFGKTRHAGFWDRRVIPLIVSYALCYLIYRCGDS